MSELPKLRRTFPEIVWYEIAAPDYTKKGELHKGSASHLHCEGQCSIHCSPTMFLFQCDYCKLKLFTHREVLPSLWVRRNDMAFTFCHSCVLQHGTSHLIYKIIQKI